MDRIDAAAGGGRGERIRALATKDPARACADILAAFEAHDGDVARASDAIDLHWISLARLVQRLGLEREIQRRWPKTVAHLR